MYLSSLKPTSIDGLGSQYTTHESLFLCGCLLLISTFNLFHPKIKSSCMKPCSRNLWRRKALPCLEEETVWSKFVKPWRPQRSWRMNKTLKMNDRIYKLVKVNMLGLQFHVASLNLRLFFLFFFKEKISKWF